MGIYTDQSGREITVNDFPRRIVSLVPSVTELLSDLNLENEVTGITKFCVRPEKWFRTKTRVGGTKNINIDAVASLRPDLIIANKEENVKEQIEQLQNIAPVWVSDVSNLEDALKMIEDIGVMTNRIAGSNIIIEKIKTNFEQLSFLPREGEQGMRVCYLIWRDPYMSAGSDTFIHDMLRCCGFENIFSHHTRYPTIKINELKTLGCQVIFLSSEPYPFKEKHVEEIQIQLPNCMIRLVDGEMFSWYGSRLIYAAAYFEKLVNEIRFHNQKL